MNTVRLWTGNWSACVAKSAGELQSSLKKISAFFETPHNLNASQIILNFNQCVSIHGYCRLPGLHINRPMKMCIMVHNIKSIDTSRLWVHGQIGKNIRVVIPSCAVSCIGAHFPPPGDEENFQFTGFRYPEL